MTISFTFDNPIWKAGGSEQNLNVQDYTHKISASGGFDSATLNFPTKQAQTEDWFINGLGRHIIVYGQSLNIIWEGFVNEISINVGVLSAKVGPLLEIANKVKVTHQTISYNTNPPVGGEQAETAFANDTTSQSNYGILESIVSGGTGSTTEMEQIRDTYIEENRSPQNDRSLNIGSSPQNATVTLSCMGYYHILDHYYYENTGRNNSDVGTKIKDVIDGDPGSRFDTVNVSANSLVVNEYEKGDKTALAIFKGS